MIKLWSKQKFNVIYLPGTPLSREIFENHSKKSETFKIILNAFSLEWITQHCDTAFIIKLTKFFNFALTLSIPFFKIKKRLLIVE